MQVIVKKKRKKKKEENVNISKILTLERKGKKTIKTYKLNRQLE